MVVKLCDFGFSKDEDRNSGSKSGCGTPEYVAPEVRSGSASGLGFSLGLGFWDMRMRALKVACCVQDEVDCCVRHVPCHHGRHCRRALVL